MDVRRLIPASRVKLYHVVNPSGEDLGQVQNFVIDPETGTVAFVVVAFGGVLGVMGKWVPIPLQVLEWDTDKARFVMDVPREMLAKAPGLDKGKWPEEFDLTWLESVYTCFGCRPYWTATARWVPRRAEGTETAVVAVSWLRGHGLTDRAGQDIGRISELVIDLQSGYLAYAAVSLTAYDEIKDRELAVPLQALTLERAEKLRLNIEREKLAGGPTYDAARVRQDHGTVGAVYAYYGYAPYWQNRRIWSRRGAPVHPPQPMDYPPDLYSMPELLGDVIRDAQNNDIGKLEDLMIDFESGFLASAIMVRVVPGAGEKLYPLPIEVLSLDPVKKIFYVAVDRETIEEAPAFARERLPRVDRERLVDVYAAYGYTPYWKKKAEHV